MAKKDKEIKQDDFTSRILKDIEKTYGEGIFIPASKILEASTEQFSISPNIDLMISGGIREGSFVSVCGPAKYGKSTLALTLAAEVQKAGRMVYYDDVEGRLDKKILTGIEGLSTSPDKFYRFGSSKETKRVLTGKEHLEICMNILRTHPGCLLIIDSLSSLAGEKELNEGFGAMSGASNAAIVTQFVRIIKDVVYINNSILLGITKMMSNPGGYGPSQKEKTALEWIYQADYRLHADSMKYWKVEEKVIGQQVDWSCKASANGPPGMKVESFIRFGIGIDKLYELYEFSKGINLIRKSGSWYCLDYLGEDKAPQYHGDFAAYTALKENPAYLEKLKEKVSQFLGRPTNEVN